MKHRLFSILTLLPLLCSCEYDFSLKKMEGESRLNIVCLSGTGDKTYFIVSKAVSITAKDTVPPIIENMKFTVNGQEKTISKEEVEEGYLSNFYVVEAPVKAGDEIALSIKANGLKEASSESVVPEKVQVRNIRTEFKKDFVNDPFGPYTENKIYFDIDLEEVSEDDFYGVEIKRHVVSKYVFEDGKEMVEEYDDYQSIDDGSDLLTFESGTGGEWFRSSHSGIKFDDEEEDFHYNLLLTSGKSVVDGHLLVNTPYMENYTYEDMEYFEWEDGSYDVLYVIKTNIFRYQLVLYKVSPEFYRYCKAKDLQNSNFLVEAGLSPATFSYSNVRNGFGVVGTISKPVFSEWVFSPDE